MHKITLLGCLLIVAAVCVLSVRGYDQYKTNHQAQLAKAAQTAALASAAKQKATATFDSEVDNLRAICEKDLANYKSLPLATQAKEVKPDCTVQFAQ